MNLMELLFGRIPEAIFFSLFMIFTKRLNSKRLLFTILVVFEYIILKSLITFNVWFQIIYTFLVFVILKVLYKDKAQIIDIFTFTLGSLIMGMIEIALYFIISLTINNFSVFVVLVNISYVLFFIVFHKKLYKIQELYKKLWNRNKKTINKMKSTTFRCINIVMFNIIFYLINLCIMFIAVQKGGV